MPSRFFSRAELSCKCGCGLCNVRPQLLARLDQVRELLGRPLIITSASRCAKHNEDSGGEVDSAHLDGWATDCAISNSTERFNLIATLIRIGVTRIGVGRYFVHFDLDPAKPQNVVWVYGGKV